MITRIIAVGIDVSKDNNQVCIKEKNADGVVKIKGTHSFSNTGKGFKELLEWVSKREKTDVCQVVYLMEATGSYYEDLAYFLYENGKQVSVVLANKIKHFSKSLNLKTKTDKVDAEMIAQYAVERQATPWKPMSPEYKELRDLCRERLSLKKQVNRAKCQLHAMEYSHEKLKKIVELKNAQIQFYDTSIIEIETEINTLINKNSELESRIAKITTVKGLGLMTVITILCETNGFGTFENIRQVVSYSGLDIVMKESGSFKGKTRISKKGNVRIRQCLFMPALTATMHNSEIKNLYKRIVEKNPTIKKKGVVAGMRKLLILTYVLWKKNEIYDPSYQWNKTSGNDENKPSFGQKKSRA